MHRLKDHADCNRYNVTVILNMSFHFMQISGIQQHQTQQTGLARFANQSAPVSKKDQFSEQDQKKLEKLKKRDAEVKQHENAHAAAAGQYAVGGPHYKTVTGPDGRQYAIGGDVSIDTSEIPDDPEATIRKAQIIRRAALAPKEPSSQDRRVAAEASKMEAKARRELAEKKKTDSHFYNNQGKTPQGRSIPSFVDITA